MNLTIKNTSRAPQGVHCVDGLKFIEPGAAKTLDVLPAYVERVKALPFFETSFPEGTIEHTTETKTAADVLAMFSDKDVHFMTAKAEAAKLLGDDMPEKKADIVAALEELATKP